MARFNAKNSYSHITATAKPRQLGTACTKMAFRARLLRMSTYHATAETGAAQSHSRAAALPDATVRVAETAATSDEHKPESRRMQPQTVSCILSAPACQHPFLSQAHAIPYTVLQTRAGACTPRGQMRPKTAAPARRGTTHAALSSVMTRSLASCGKPSTASRLDWK